MRLTNREGLAHVSAGIAFMLCAALASGQAPVPPAHVPVVKEGTTVKVSEHVYLIPDERVPMVPNLFPAFSMPQSRSDSWIESLDRLGALKPRTVIGAHYDMTDASVIEGYRGYLKALQARVMEVKKQGKTSDETAELLRTEFRNKYPDWQQPLRIHNAVTRIYAEQL